METNPSRSVESLVQANVDSFFKGEERAISAFLNRCDSPLSKLLGSAFLRHYLDLADIGTFLEAPMAVSESGVVTGCFCGSQNVYYTIEANREIHTAKGTYRPDFVFKVFEPNSSEYGRVIFLFGVEVDGHDFHEKTREQVRRDKSRDRSLLQAGVKLLRFSGSEVFHSLDDVLDEISDFMFAEGKRAGLWEYHSGTVDDWEMRKNMRPHQPDV